MQQIQVEEFGGSDQLRLQEVPEPSLLPHQVCIRTHAAAVNPIDFKTRLGLGFVADKLRARLPWVPGYDLAGTLCAVGDEVSGWKPQQRVCGLVNFPLPGGAYSEKVITSPEALAEIPEGVSDSTAAALPLAGLTAWQGLFEAGNLCSGQRILVLAAAGGVGHLACQLARKHGAQVWGTASKRHHAFLSELDVAPVDYHDPNALAELVEHYGQFDFIFDGVGGETGITALQYLHEDGVLVTLPTVTAEKVISTATREGKKAVNYTVHPDGKQLSKLLESVASGQLRVKIDRELPLAEAAAAHAYVEEGHSQGKVVLTV